MSYSQIRDVAYEAIAATMTKTPIGSEASIKQLGYTRATLVGRMAEAVADEISAMLESPDVYRKPSDRYQHDARHFSEPGAYDADRGTPPPPSSSPTPKSGEELFS